MMRRRRCNTNDLNVFSIDTMTLTVRLDNAIESALERHCAERRVTKSAVVQRSLATYLMGDAEQQAMPKQVRGVSPIFTAFDKAGLVGTGALRGESADKNAVRARAIQRILRGRSPAP
jgi:hypothetical protein